MAIYPFLYALHILAGSLSILAGATALASAKGARIHRTAGAIFTLSMIATGLAAAWLGYYADPRDPADIVSGLITAYLVATAWLAARRRDGESGIPEILGCIIIAGGSLIGFLVTYQTMRDGTAFLGGVPGMIFSSVAALAALLDFSVILRGGISGKQRIARHLWRMCLGFFIAVGSFFPGQLQIFPRFIQTFEPQIVLFLPAFSIIIFMLFWLSRLAFTRANRLTPPSTQS